MHSLKKLAVLPAVFISAAAFFGCTQKQYSLYTNIPQSGYTVLDKNYKNVTQIAGYQHSDKIYNDEDTTGFTTKRRLYFAMVAEAELIVMSDFSSEQATDRFDEFSKQVSTTLNSIDKALSTTVENSDISLFNKAEAGAELEINQITYNVLSEAKSVYNLTQGYYNPALYYNVIAYGFGGEEDRPQTSADLPSDETIGKYTDLASHFSEVQLAEREGRYYVTKPEYTVQVEDKTCSLKLDLGGIGKGYAVDRVDELFEEYGYKFGHFNFAASSMLVKSHPNLGAYNVSFIGPRSPSRDVYIQTTVRNEKISTSGDNEQFYIIDGVRYSHVIDPTTGKPVQTGIMSATVIGGGAARADALTTAIMAMGSERAIKFAEEKLTDVRVIFTCEE